MTLPAEVAWLLPAGLPLPVYPPGPHCNPRGLSTLGEYALTGMMRRGMVVEVDHMSAKAAARTLDILETANYPGIVSTHSWMDTHLTERSTGWADSSRSTVTTPTTSSTRCTPTRHCAPATAWATASAWT